MFRIGNLFERSKYDKVFEKSGFSKSNATIFVINSRNSENPSNYYLKDHNYLQKIKDDWKFRKKDSLGRCGYDYQITNQDDNNSKSIHICFLCNTLLISEGDCYEINKKQIYDLLNGGFAQFRTEIKTFDNIKAGRNYWLNERQSKELVIFENKLPDWIKFDGHFMAWFKLKDQPSEDNDNSKDEKELVEAKFKKYLDNFSIGEDYELFYFTKGGSAKGNAHSFLVYCTKDFFRKINGLDISYWKEITEVKLELIYWT